MANKPRSDNPARPVRVEDELWEAAKQAAADQGTTVSAVMREALRRLVAGDEAEALLAEHEQAVHGPRNGPAWYVVCKCGWSDEWPDLEVTVPERVEDWFTNDARYGGCHERADARHRHHVAEVLARTWTGSPPAGQEPSVTRAPKRANTGDLV